MFTYPGLEKATWDVIGFDDHWLWGQLILSLPKHLIFLIILVNLLIKILLKILLKMILNALSQIQWGRWLNFVLPSIKPASDVLSYTDPVHLGPYTFRVLKKQ